MLRLYLGPELAKLIEGINADLKAAWKYLDVNYGDPRVVSDTVINDIEKFIVIQSGEESRFCDLVNLVRRSYNILKEVKRPQDLDNTHVISLIERKMLKDDLRVWVRHLTLHKVEPTMANLLEWMEEAMSARLRTGANIRKNRQSSHPSINAFSVDQPNQSKNFKPSCYVCQGMHYVDECTCFKNITPVQRYKIVQEQRACFCCLKRGKGHTAINCSKKRECNEMNEMVHLANISITSFYMVVCQPHKSCPSEVSCKKTRVMQFYLWRLDM